MLQSKLKTKTFIFKFEQFYLDYKQSMTAINQGINMILAYLFTALRASLVIRR